MSLIFSDKFAILKRFIDEVIQKNKSFPLIFHLFCTLMFIYGECLINNYYMINFFDNGSVLCFVLQNFNI